MIPDLKPRFYITRNFSICVLVNMLHDDFNTFNSVAPYLTIKKNGRKITYQQNKVVHNLNHLNAVVKLFISPQIKLNINIDNV